MSAYQSNTFSLRGTWYDIVEGSAFSPFEFGIGPYSADTYTPLGFTASVGLINGQLHLLHLYTNHDPNELLLVKPSSQNVLPDDTTQGSHGKDTHFDEPLCAKKRRRIQPPLLNSVMATTASDNYWNYSNVNLPLNYTGTLVIDRMPLITGDESEHYIRQAIKAIVDSGSHITRWTLHFENGVLVDETAHEPDKDLAELIHCYASRNPFEADSLAPVDSTNAGNLNKDFTLSAPTTDSPFTDDAMFADFDLEPSGANKKSQ